MSYLFIPNKKYVDSPFSKKNLVFCIAKKLVSVCSCKNTVNFFKIRFENQVSLLLLCFSERKSRENVKFANHRV